MSACGSLVGKLKLLCVLRFCVVLLARSKVSTAVASMPPRRGLKTRRGCQTFADGQVRRELRCCCASRVHGGKASGGKHLQTASHCSDLRPPSIYQSFVVLSRRNMSGQLVCIVRQALQGSASLLNTSKLVQAGCKLRFSSNSVPDLIMSKSGTTAAFLLVATSTDLRQGVGIWDR